MYLKGIIMYLLWPALIWVSWLLTGYFLRLYKRNNGDENQNPGEFTGV